MLSSGADGLLKLWDTRSGTNLATFESHDDRLWGLTVSQSPEESLLASGGADSRIVVWRDVTADKAAAAEAEEEQLVMKQQELSNALAVRLVYVCRCVCVAGSVRVCFVGVRLGQCNTGVGQHTCTAFAVDPHHHLSWLFTHHALFSILPSILIHPNHQPPPSTTAPTHPTHPSHPPPPQPPTPTTQTGR